jgi:Cdc6-like AAA superfamily ATPase
METLDDFRKAMLEKIGSGKDYAPLAEVRKEEWAQQEANHREDEEWMRQKQAAHDYIFFPRPKAADVAADAVDYRVLESTTDFRLQAYCRIILAGPPGCGKTRFCQNLLRYRDEMFSVPPAQVLYYYRAWQPIFNEMKVAGLVDQFLEGIPTMEQMEELREYEDRGGCIVVIDDQVQNITAELAELFQVGSRHNAINLILMTQNLFSKNRFYRDISLSAKYTVLFKNPRDASTITNFAKQFCPGNIQFVTSVYAEATKKGYGYLFCDFDQDTESDLRLRTNIFPHEWPMLVFMEKKACK